MLTSKPDVAEKFKELGINYILDQSTYEENPLGRVEWAKFYAALCNEEDAATTMYNAQAAYVDTLSKAEKTENPLRYSILLQRASSMSEMQEIILHRWSIWQVESTFSLT